MRIPPGHELSQQALLSSRAVYRSLNFFSKRQREAATGNGKMQEKNLYPFTGGGGEDTEGKLFRQD
jgi:hypothetical protein